MRPLSIPPPQPPVQLAVESLVAARWTDAIHDEWIRSLAKDGRVTRERLIATRDLMKAVLSDADVRDYEHHVSGIALPDPDDRHVLAAAIAARASTILTWNVKHFPDAETAKLNVDVRDPDVFLTVLAGEDPDAITAVVDAARANLRITEPTAEEYLLALDRQGLKAFVAHIRNRETAGR